MNSTSARKSIVIDAPSHTVSVTPVETDPHADRIAQLELLATAMDDMIQIPEPISASGWIQCWS